MTTSEFNFLVMIRAQQTAAINADTKRTWQRIERKDRELVRLRSQLAEMNKALATTRALGVDFH